MIDELTAAAILILLGLSLGLLIGCTTVRIDFMCRSYPHESGLIISECGDAQSWQEWHDKQAKLEPEAL